MSTIEFANPGFLYLLFLLIPLIIWYVLKNNENQASIQLSTLEGFKYAPQTYKHILRHVVFGFRCLVVALFIFILSRPQQTNKWQNTITEGIDIVIALDISGSMLAQDFQPDRLEAAKNVATEFISGRPLDRIGLVVFSGESFTQCPLTSDHAVVINLMKDIRQGMIDDGTAIGLGLANSVNRLKDSKAISKVVILLTDGVNNVGEIAPLTAADIAASFGIRVYTVGVGRNGYAPYPVQTAFGTQYQNMPVEIDESVLKEISSKTGGQYFRATDNLKLKEIYKEIDKLEKSKIEVRRFSQKQEFYIPFAIIAAALLLFEILLRLLFLKNLP